MELLDAAGRRTRKGEANLSENLTGTAAEKKGLGGGSKLSCLRWPTGPSAPGRFRDAVTKWRRGTAVPYSAQPSSPASQLCRRPCSSLSPAAKPFQPRILVQWQPPRIGWFKLNFDGSVKYDGSGRASMGGVIRDHSGRVLAAFAEPTEHWSVGVVEARALIRGLRLALDCFLGRLVVEGDDQVLVKLLRGEDTQTRIPVAVHDEILMLLGRFLACEVQHVYREGNQVADALCHQAYHTPGEWRGGIMLPLAVLEKVEDDAHGAVYERIPKAKG